jgi:hypothetical protein
MNIQDEPKRDHIIEFLALHKPQHQADLMVYEVWQDGEITLTKGADLWRQRGLHMIRFPVKKELAMPADRMPIRYGDNGSIIVATHEEAETAHALVVLYATERLERSVLQCPTPSAAEANPVVA